MVDMGPAKTTTTTLNATVANDADDISWEVAVDSGIFEKQLEQHEKARAAAQESVLPLLVSSSTNSVAGDDNDENRQSMAHMLKSNKPIRILKRPTSQSQLPITNGTPVSSTTSTGSSSSHQNNNNCSIATSSVAQPSSLSTSSAASATSSTPYSVPVVVSIARNPAKEAANAAANSFLAFNSSSAVKAPIKTYEQREMEYRIARLRIMGEEESSAKDEDESPPPSAVPVMSTTVSSGAAPESTNTTISSATVSQPPPPTPTSNKNQTAVSSSSSTSTRNPPGVRPPSLLQSHSQPNSYSSNLYQLNNTINFTPTTNNNVGISAPFSSPNFPQPSYRYSAPYSQHYGGTMPPAPLSSSTNAPSTSTAAHTFYMTSTAPFITATSIRQPVMNSSWYQHQPHQSHQHPQQQ